MLEQENVLAVWREVGVDKVSVAQTCGCVWHNRAVNLIRSKAVPRQAAADTFSRQQEVEHGAIRKTTGR